VTSSLLTIINGQQGELVTVSNGERKHKEQETVEYHRHEVEMSLEARAKIMADARIALELNVKASQVITGQMTEGQSGEEHVEENRIEAASALILPAGQARIVSSKSSGDMATFLIVTADF
jgi:hypothetical protein